MKKDTIINLKNQEMLDWAKQYEVKMDNLIEAYGIEFAMKLLCSVKKTNFRSPTSVELIYPDEVNTDELRGIYLDMVIEAGFHFKEFSGNYKDEGVQLEPLYQIFCLGFN